MPVKSPRPHHPMARILSEMCAAFGLSPQHDVDTDKVEISGVVSDAVRVEDGDVLVLATAEVEDAAAEVELALERGAAAILTDLTGAKVVPENTVPVLVVDDPRLALGHVAEWVYRTDPTTPRLVGVLGSSGKTSVAYLLDALLKALGIKTGMATNLLRLVDEERFPAAGERAEADELHAMIARMREVGVHVASCEIAASDVARHRIDGLYFDVLGFVGAEARDDESAVAVDFERTAELFSPEHAHRGVVNIDSEWGRRLVEETRIPVVTISSNPGQGADWLVAQTPSDGGVEIELRGPDDRSLRSWSSFASDHAAINLGAAIIMLDGAGWDVEQIQAALDRAGGMRLTALEGHEVTGRES